MFGVCQDLLNCCPWSRPRPSSLWPRHRRSPLFAALTKSQTDLASVAYQFSHPVGSFHCVPFLPNHGLPPEPMSHILTPDPGRIPLSQRPCFESHWEKRLVYRCGYHGPTTGLKPTQRKTLFEKQYPSGLKMSSCGTKGNKEPQVMLWGNSRSQHSNMDRRVTRIRCL